jgi:colanic acid/amylovoran biosynthesis protein
MVFPLLLSIRVNKKTIIYSQSIGPLENKVSQIIFKYIAPKFTKIYLREKVCLSLFDELGITLDNVEVIPDSAFYLNIEKEEDKEIAIFNNQNFKVGITARPHEFRSSNQDELYENYIDSLVYNISWLVQEKNSTVYLFPQVIGPAAIENDLLALNYIYEKLDDNVKKSVVYLKNDYSPRELKKLYSHMDIFIATRLHSAIFAMSSGVPTINISYHGTKSKGIMGMVGLEKYIIDIDKITNDNLQEKINNIIKNKIDIKNKLLNEVKKLNEELENSMSKVIISHIDNMMN